MRPFHFSKTLNGFRAVQNERLVGAFSQADVGHKRLAIYLFIPHGREIAVIRVARDGPGSLRRGRLGPVLALVVFTAAVVILGTSGLRQRGLQETEKSLRPAPLPPAMEVGHPMPQFELPALRGERFSLSAFQGHPLVINFFASWCESCWADVRHINAVYEEYRTRGLTVLGIGVLDNRDAHAWMVEKFSITYPTVYDATGEIVGNVLKLCSTPTTVLVDRDGIVMVRWEGRLDEEILRREVEKLL